MTRNLSAKATRYGSYMATSALRPKLLWQKKLQRGPTRRRLPFANRHANRHAEKRRTSGRWDGSVCDAEPRRYVPRTFQLVEYSDGVVLEGDEALSLVVDEKLIAGCAVLPRAIP